MRNQAQRAKRWSTLVARAINCLCAASDRLPPPLSPAQLLPYVGVDVLGHEGHPSLQPALAQWFLCNCVVEYPTEPNLWVLLVKRALYLAPKLLV